MFFPIDACPETPEEQSFQKSVANDAKSACRTSTLALVAWLSMELMYKVATQCSFGQFIPGLLGIISVALGPSILSVLAKKMRQSDENKNAACSPAWGEVAHQQAALVVAWCITGCFLRSQWGLRGQIISYEGKAWPDLYNNSLWELAFCGTQIAISFLRLPYRTAHFVLLFHLVLDVAMWLNGAVSQDGADPNVTKSKSVGASFAPLWATLLRLLAHSIITSLCLHQVHWSENLAREAHKMSSALEHQQQVGNKLVEVVDRLLCETFGCVAYVDASSTLNVLSANTALEQLFGDNVVGQPLLCRTHGVQESWRLVSYMRGIIDPAIGINKGVPFIHEAATTKFVFQHSSGRSIHALTLAVYMPGSVRAGGEACVMMGFRRLASYDATAVCDAGFSELEPLLQPQPAVTPPSISGQVESTPPISGAAPTLAAAVPDLAAERQEFEQMSVVAPNEAAVSDLVAARTIAIAPSVVAAATDKFDVAVAASATVTGAGDVAARSASAPPAAMVVATDKLAASTAIVTSGLVAAAHEVVAATLTVVPPALAAATEEVAARTIAVSPSAIAAEKAKSAAVVAPSGASTVSDEVATRAAGVASSAKAAATDEVAAGMVVAAPSGLSAPTGEVATAIATAAPSAIVTATDDAAARTAAVAPAAVFSAAGEVAAATCAVAFSAGAAANEDEIAARTVVVAPSIVVAAADQVAAAAPAVEAITDMTPPGDCHAAAAAAAPAAAVAAAAAAAATANFEPEAPPRPPGIEMDMPEYAEAQRFKGDHDQVQPAAPDTMMDVSIEVSQVFDVQTTTESSHIVEEMTVQRRLAEEAATSALPSAHADSMQENLKISLVEENLNVKPKSIGAIGHPNKCGLPCKFVWTVKGCKDGDQCLRCHICSWKKTRSTDQPQDRRNQRGVSREVSAKLPKPAFTAKTGEGTRKHHGKQSRKSAASPESQQFEFNPGFELQLNAQSGAQFAQEGRVNALVPQTQFGSFVPVCLSEEGSVDFAFAPYDAPNFQANWSICSSSQDGSAQEFQQMPQQQGFHGDDVQSPKRRNVAPMTLIPSRPDDAPGLKNTLLDTGNREDDLCLAPTTLISSRPNDALGPKSALLARGNREDDPCHIEPSIMREVRVQNCFLHVDRLPSESAFRRDDWPPGARSEPGDGKWAAVGPIRRSF